MFLFVVFLIVFYLVKPHKEKRIFDNKGETIGVITDYYVIFPQSHYLVYEYQVDNIQYRNKVSAEKVFESCNEDRKCIGLKFLVIYDVDAPKNSLIILEQPR